MIINICIILTQKTAICLTMGILRSNWS